MPPRHSLQQLSTLHCRHVDVFEFCFSGEPSAARPLAMSTPADAFQWTTTSESAGSRAPFAGPPANSRLWSSVRVCKSFMRLMRRSQPEVSVVKVMAMATPRRMTPITHWQLSRRKTQERELLKVQLHLPPMSRAATERIAIPVFSGRAAGDVNPTFKLRMGRFFGDSDRIYRFTD
jgi:hypothetical protein